jgi:hypothetical protein
MKSHLLPYEASASLRRLTLCIIVVYVYTCISYATILLEDRKSEIERVYIQKRLSLLLAVLRDCSHVD